MPQPRTHSLDKPRFHMNVWLEILRQGDLADLEDIIVGAMEGDPHDFVRVVSYVWFKGSEYGRQKEYDAARQRLEELQKQQDAAPRLLAELIGDRPFSKR